MNDQPPQPSDVSVAICAITYRRPQYLEHLLSGIGRLTFQHSAPRVRVVIVENETDGPGREVCDRLRPTFPFALEHYEEPRRGIPFARNAALVRAGDADFIAFIDDDESPEPMWLDELLRVQAQYDADLVGGPVLPVYESTPPEWIVRGGFHERPRFPTGTPQMPNGTNNVLIRRSVLAGMEEPFEARFAMIGGSDTIFFRKLLEAGCSSVWADEALVTEVVPDSRATMRWILARTFRTSWTRGLVARESENPLAAVRNIIWRAVRNILLGCVSLPVNLFRGRHAIARSLIRFARGAGILSGLVGLRYEEYRKIHGQ